MIIQDKEATRYIGGGAISAAFISACSSLFNTLYKFGQDLGSTVRRWVTGTSCN